MDLEHVNINISGEKLQKKKGGDCFEFAIDSCPMEYFKERPCPCFKPVGQFVG